MVAKTIVSSSSCAVNGYLTMTVPALRKTENGEYELPKFLSKKTGGEAVCAAEWVCGEPEPLYVLNGETEEPWEQDTDVNFEVAKDKELYIISYDSDGYKTFFKVKASGDIAKRIHKHLKKGDHVVAFGEIATLGRNNFITVKDILKVEKIQ